MYFSQYRIMLWKNTNANQLSSPLDNTIIMALSALSARGSLTASHQRDSPRWSVNPRERVVAMAGTISRPAGLHTAHSFNFSLSSPARCPLCPPLPAAWPFFLRPIALRNATHTTCPLQRPKKVHFQDNACMPAHHRIWEQVSTYGSQWGLM